ncbi:MAG: dienelactone hydrolase [Myxococcota bacterium]|jgi:dienelactone hydrolase
MIRRITVGLVALLSVSPLLGCETDEGLTLKFDRSAVDPSEHVFPSDRYRGDETLDSFSELQLETLPFLRQLGRGGEPAYAGTGAIRIAFTEAETDPTRWLDEDTLAAGIRLYRTSTSTPVLVPIAQFERDQRNNTVIFRPRAPLPPGEYSVIVEDGVLKTRAGASVGPSADYRRVIRDGDPLTDATFGTVISVDTQVDRRSDTIAFFSFSVVDDTSTGLLLREYLRGERPVDQDGEDVTIGVTPWSPLQGRQISAIDATVLANDAKTVAAYFAAAGLSDLPNDAIGRVVTGRIATPNFVSDPIDQLLEIATNQTFKGRVRAAPFGVANPLSLSESTPSRALPYLMLLPVVPAGDPVPIAVAIHGVSRQKEDWLAAANAICAAGYGVIAIDLYQHGARQFDIAIAEGGYSSKLDPALALLGTRFPDPFINPTFLARTRDKLRQSVGDQLALIRLLVDADGINPVIDLDGDGAPDSYGAVSVLGTSLGAMLATVIGAISPDVERVFLNVPGGPINQVIVDSPSLSTQLNALIYLVANASGFGLLAGTDTPMLPHSGPREIFSRVAEVILGPIDPNTYAGALLDGRLGNAKPKVLVQFASNDLVITKDNNRRFAWALEAGGSQDSGLVHLKPVMFDLDLPVVEGGSGTLPAAGVTQFSGGHGLLFDFADPAVTAAAQGELVKFLAGP